MKKIIASVLSFVLMSLTLAACSNGGTTPSTTPTTSTPTTTPSSAETSTHNDIITDVDGEKMFNITQDEFISAWNDFYDGILPSLTSPYLEPDPSSDYDVYMYTLHGSKDSVNVIFTLSVNKESNNIDGVTYTDFTQYYKQNENLAILCYIGAIAIITNDNSSEYTDSVEIMNIVVEKGEYTKDGVRYEGIENNGALLFVIMPDS